MMSSGLLEGRQRLSKSWKIERLPVKIEKM
jgi:hypothetical protein